MTNQTDTTPLLPNQPVFQADHTETPEGSYDSTIEDVADEIEHDTRTLNVHTISPLQTYGILINYIIGTGVFGLPFAFQNAGLGLSAITILFFYVMSIITALWVLENMARSSGVMDTYRVSRNAQKPANQIEFEVYNYTRMSAIFFGKLGKLATIVFMSMSCYGALWAYTSVFSSSITLLLWKYPLKSFGECSTNMSEWGLFSNCHWTYLAGIAFFGIIVVPLSLMGVAEQAILQAVLTVWRFFCFSLMAITCIVDIIYSVVVGTFVAVPENKTLTTFFFDVAGFGTLFSSCSVALTCHQNLPDVVTPMRPKTYLRSVMIGGITTASLIYVIIGFAGSLCFGADTKTPVTHNWLNFTGCGGGFTPCEDGTKATWIGIVVQWLVLLSPPINLTSEYPLVCVTLSSNLLQMVPKKWKDERPKTWTYAARLLASTPPLVAGMIKGDLEVIFNFTGIFGFFLLFIIPGVLQIYSKFIIRRKWGSKTYVTVYSGKYSTSYLAWPVLVVAIMCFSLALVQFVDTTFGLGLFG